LLFELREVGCERQAVSWFVWGVLVRGSRSIIIMDQGPEDSADRDRIRDGGIKLREIVVPEWKPEESLRTK
jgi:hypothetical protein